MLSRDRARVYLCCVGLGWAGFGAAWAVVGEYEGGVCSGVAVYGGCSAEGKVRVLVVYTVGG